MYRESGSLTVLPTVQSPRLSAEMERLQRENLTLSNQVQQLSGALEKETGQRLVVEGENEELRRNLQAIEGTIAKRTDEVRRYQTALSSCFHELDKALPALDALRQAVAEGAAT